MIAVSYLIQIDFDTFPMLPNSYLTVGQLDRRGLNEFVGMLWLLGREIQKRFFLFTCIKRFYQLYK